MDSQQMVGKFVDQQGSLQNAVAKPRLKWTRALHEQFVAAVARLGGADKATPKSVMRIMGVPGLTLYHLKSHLQKYRLAKNRGADARQNDDEKEGCSRPSFRDDWDHGDTDMDISSNPTEINESMLQMQMEVQKQLQEQIEVQKHLQLRIEAQGKYLQSVLKRAEETLTAYHLSFTVQEPKANLALQHGKDHSDDSCVTTSEKSERKSHDKALRKSADHSVENSLDTNRNLKGSERSTCAQESQSAVQSNRKEACAEEQTSPESCEELFDLNR